LFSVSEIAFDQQHNHAAVSYSFWCGSLCGNGATVIFEKIDGQWKKTNRNCGGWVSWLRPLPLRLSSDGKVPWSAPDLGLDGVVVTSAQNRTIQGDGELDPPGGWKPFALRLDSDELLAG